MFWELTYKRGEIQDTVDQIAQQLCPDEPREAVERAVWWWLDSAIADLLENAVKHLGDERGIAQQQFQSAIEPGRTRNYLEKSDREDAKKLAEVR